jgi:hypothetical protein
MVGVIAIIILISFGAYLTGQKNNPTSSAQTSKPVILYVNQGNALVSAKNFTNLASFAKTNGFNTIFFQVYRSGSLLFSQSNLTYFVSTAHSQNLKIYFALYFTGDNQQIPVSLYDLGEDGINLDMSTLALSQQSNLLSTLQENYKGGMTAVTTTNFATDLKPNLLILETYQPADQSFIHPGIIGSVEPLALTSRQQYISEFQYALQHSNGVMVFDYYGLLRTGY